MSNEIVTIEPQTALSIFAGQQTELDSILAGIAEKARAIVPDVTTAKGRAAIASNAAKVSSSKAAIEKAGKELADRQKEIPKMIDASRKRSRDFLDALRDEVRQPLAEWEAEQARIKTEKEEAERVEAARIESERQAEQARIEAERQAEQDRIEADRLFALLWDEAHIMNDRFDFDKEKAEAAKARQAEQDEKDRLAREAELIEQGRLAAEQAGKDALAKAEFEKLQAEQREKQVIENARIAKNNAELLKKQQLIDAENARVAALEKAEREQLQAVEDERKRVKAEAAKQEAIDNERAANTKHRTAIKTQVKNALIYAGLTEEQAKTVVNLAIADKLGALKIQF